MKKLIIFISAFVLNLLWENLHAPFYASYKDGAITEQILIRAAFWDAVIVLIVAIVFLKISFLKRHLWLSFFAGALISVAIEYFALATGRWSYGQSMPIIPLLNIGLTPAIQLGLIAYGILLLMQKNYGVKGRFKSPEAL